MKKMTSIFSASLLALSLCVSPAYADLQFTDLAADHWAYADVQALVAEGTISGYEDGSFRPSGTVTRAEFVKMLGKGPTRYSADFSDVSPEHWAYEYVMYSGLVPDGSTTFLPDQQIKRSEVIDLLWKRAGSPTGFSAPSIITDQANNENSVAWAYSLGILTGDDGVKLRLGDTMSRAEGAALILRAREKSSAGATASFVSTVSENLLGQAFESLDLFDDPAFTPDRAVTYGELARAAVRIACSEHDPSYATLPSVTPFEHEYARDLDVLGKYVIGEDKISAEIIDQQITVADAIAAITFGAIHRSATPYAVDVASDEFSSLPQSMNHLLTFALNRGVQIDTQNTAQQLNRKATLKDVAAVLVQVDYIIGLQTDYSTDSNVLGSINYNHSLDISNRYYEGFQMVLDGIPNEVYTTPFTTFADKAKTPKESYRFAQAYSSIFSTSLTFYMEYVKENSGADFTFVYYPSLTVDNGNGYTMRVKVTVNETNGAKTLGDCFLCGENADAAYSLENGNTFYADIASGETLGSSSMDPEKMFLDQIVWGE